LLVQTHAGGVLLAVSLPCLSSRLTIKQRFHILHASCVPKTFIDAPNAASGPIPDDVAPFFAGPYYEW
jgi:hypothetical protein